MIETPIKNKYKQRIAKLDQQNKLLDLTKLSVGDYICIPPSERSSGITGFVIKISRVNVKIVTQYRGWGDSDSNEMELTIRKTDIKMFYKPKQ